MTDQLHTALATLEVAARDMDPAEVPGMVIRLAGILAVLGAYPPAQMNGASPSGEDRPLTTDDDDLLADDVVAQILGVPTSFVADLRRSGALPGRPVGEKYIRTRRGDLRKYVAGLPNVTYSRRHDRRGRAAVARSARGDTGRAGTAGGSRTQQRGAVGAGGNEGP